MAKRVDAVGNQQESGESLPMGGEGEMQPMAHRPNAPVPHVCETPGFAFQTGQPHKVHKSYIFTSPLIALGMVLLVSLNGGLSNVGELLRLMRTQSVAQGLPVFALFALAAAVVFLALLTAAYALTYKHMAYAFDEREFSFSSGVFVKKRVHIPYEKVQSVNYRSSLVQRLLGVCTVTIDSAGGASNKGVRVPYVGLREAELMRTELFLRKAQVVGGAPGSAPMPATPAVSGAAPNVLEQAAAPVTDFRGAFGGEAAAAVFQEPVSFEFGLSNKELLLASVTHPGPLVGALVSAASLALVASFALFVGDSVAFFLAALAVPLAVGIFLAVWIIGSIGLLLGYGGFKVRRRGTRIEVERGLISRTFNGIDVARIQSLEMRQSLVRRLLGYAELSLGRIDAAGQDGSNESKNADSRGLVIHPFLKANQVEGLLDGLLPEFSDRPRVSDRTPLPRPALRRALLRRCLWQNWALWSVLGAVACWFGVLAIFVAEEGVDAAGALREFAPFMVGFFAVCAVVLVVATVLIAIGAVLWARHSGWAVERRFLMVHNDGLTTATSIVPRQKIQSGALRDNPFQRRQRLATLQAITAAGTGSTTVRLIDVAEDQGQAYLQWLE